MRPCPCPATSDPSLRRFPWRRWKTAFAKAGGGTGPLQSSYLSQAHEDYADDETPELGGADLAALLARVWTSADVRKAGEAAARLRPALAAADGSATGYDVVSIVQDDRPFLVDSVMGELADAGVSVRALFHPVVTLGRDASGARIAGDHRESMIVVVIDPLPAERRETLTAALVQTLADVQAAVADHGAMHALMERSVAHLEACPGTVDPPWSPRRWSSCAGSTPTISSSSAPATTTIRAPPTAAMPMRSRWVRSRPGSASCAIRSAPSCAAPPSPPS
jgi:hypothetical protein